MNLRLLLLLSLLQWSFSCFSVQAITTPVVYYGKVLSGGKGIANVPVTDGTQIVLTSGQYFPIIDHGSSDCLHTETGKTPL